MGKSNPEHDPGRFARMGGNPPFIPLWQRGKKEADLKSWRLCVFARGMTFSGSLIENPKSAIQNRLMPAHALIPTSGREDFAKPVAA
jgi:hypothetical protein